MRTFPALLVTIGAVAAMTAPAPRAAEACGNAVILQPSEAKAILEDLAQKDVLATPYAYAALAQLRDAAGDAAGRDEALAKCRTMAASKSICAAPAAAPGP
jgi:hypothetical protein